MRAPKEQNPRSRAREVLTELGITSYPIDVQRIAQRKGIAVRYIPLDSELSGMIFDDGAVTIVVNSLHHTNRQRFTLAHELGHFELHMKEIGSAVHVDKKFLAFARGPKSSSGEDRREIEANSFASELLVPEPMLAEELRGQLVDLENEELIRGLAGKFQVSTQMMTFRVAAHVSG